MIYRYRFGRPFPTEAVMRDIPVSQGEPVYGSFEPGQGFSFKVRMDARDAIYGLGENVRGINKRGFEYISDASDDPFHYETTRSLYGAHNFILVSGERSVGLFFDQPARMTFDLGYSKQDTIHIYSESGNLDVYMIEAECEEKVVREFRQLIGRSYIPPRFAFGYGQSRWGYKTPEDFREVVREHRQAHVPLDMVYMDIDYMDHFKDFTVDPVNFPDFPAFVKEMKEQHIQLVPIIDAGVKIEPGYDVYEEGVEQGFFCTYEDDSCFTACVWPGYTHFPDILNPLARAWFGSYYKRLTDAGIEGFWNDMCEPAIFFTPEELKKTRAAMKESLDLDEPVSQPQRIADLVRSMSNNHADYRRMFHHVNGERICHEDVHNLFGYGMTRAAGEAFERDEPEKRRLMFSRSSYIGAHRYGGIWMGDNMSWWSHLRMNLAMLPSLNMCGFLYTGADLAGFGADTTRDLALRWLALGVFTPLMRNHSCNGTRRQEFYRFEGTDDFRTVIRVRYQLLPYLYSTFVKAALEDRMMFKPLAFDYPGDPIARECEDQLMLGDECMITPVVQQNAFGRVVYLPEEMMLVMLGGDGTKASRILPAGHHYIEVELNEVPLFVRPGKCIPLAEPGEYVDDIDAEDLTLVGYVGSTYELFWDDGYGKNYEKETNFRIMKM